MLVSLHMDWILASFWLILRVFLRSSENRVCIMGPWMQVNMPMLHLLLRTYLALSLVSGIAKQPTLASSPSPNAR